MIDLENKTFKLSDNKEYEVIEHIEYNSKTYVYLVNINDKLDSVFKEIKKIDNEYYIDDIDKELFKKEIINKFINKINED